jgi:Tfp pilus assembly protein PilO
MTMGSTNRIIVAMIAVVVLAGAFWVLLLSPKRDELGKLETRVSVEETSLAQNRAEVADGLNAQKAFPDEYQQLVVLGEATPADSETASLLVQLNRIAGHAHIDFLNFQLNSSGGAGEEAPSASAPAESGESGAYPSATEVAASTLPLGASIGSAGLAVMPYTLTFKGDFFHIADFIRGLDSMVKTKNASVEVTGRLVTINSFTLSEDQTAGFPVLDGSFSVTTYLVPPGQGLTGGATPVSPEATATQVSATTGAAQ